MNQRKEKPTKLKITIRDVERSSAKKKPGSARRIVIKETFPDRTKIKITADELAESSLQIQLIDVFKEYEAAIEQHRRNERELKENHLRDKTAASKTHDQSAHLLVNQLEEMKRNLVDLEQDLSNRFSEQFVSQIKEIGTPNVQRKNPKEPTDIVAEMRAYGNLIQNEVLKTKRVVNRILMKPSSKSIFQRIIDWISETFSQQDSTRHG